MSTIFSVISEINVVNGFFMELFYTSNIDTVKECQMFFLLVLFSTDGSKNFRKNIRTSRMCQIVNNCKLSYI